MKKGLFLVTTLVCFIVLFSGCIKNSTNLTINPSMTGVIALDTFNASTVQPSLLKPQLNDSVTSLYITGYNTTTKDQMVLKVTRYNELTGTFSIIAEQAGATYLHNGILNTATSGLVAITNITSNTITGYYSFTTDSGLTLTNGTFVVARPFNY